ncbi:hypothetical protein FRC11_006662 [Ceratobasidium sp. 423]|nr:hypothetical protein FRC11_006662 [Ceratobasidium sp. 423]
MSSLYYIASIWFASKVDFLQYQKIRSKAIGTVGMNRRTGYLQDDEASQTSPVRAIDYGTRRGDGLNILSARQHDPPPRSLGFQVTRWDVFSALHPDDGYSIGLDDDYDLCLDDDLELPGYTDATPVQPPISPTPKMEVDRQALDSNYAQTETIKRPRPPSLVSISAIYPGLPISKRARVGSGVEVPVNIGLSHELNHPNPKSRPIMAKKLDPSVRTVQNVKPSEMTLSEMYECLIEHGCSDLQSSIHPHGFSSCRVAEGGFGDIWKGKLIDGTGIAVKVLRFALVHEDESKNLKRVMREIYNWSKLEHKNINKLLGVTMLEGRLGMVSTWMEHGTLQKYLKQHDNINRHSLCVQVAEGVVYLHSMNVIHGDLKTPNILVSLDGTPKLTDFDHSVISDSSLQFSATTRVSRGTTRWMAPELMDEGPQEKTKSTDVYALGMTFLEILTNALPYSECQSDFQVVVKLTRKELPKRSIEHFPEDEGGNLRWDLLTQCWNHNPKSRPTAEGAIISVGASFKP